MTTTIRDILITSIKAAEQRGYDRAVAEFQSIIDGATDRAPQPVVAAPPTSTNGLTRSEQAALTFVRNNPGLTAAEFRKAGFRSVGPLYTLVNLGLIRKEGPRYQPKGSKVIPNKPWVRFYPIEGDNHAS